MFKAFEFGSDIKFTVHIGVLLSRNIIPQVIGQLQKVTNRSIIVLSNVMKSRKAIDYKVTKFKLVHYV